MSLKDYINKIQRVFLEINAITKDDDCYEYVTITQVYCKFLMYNNFNIININNLKISILNI